jgi:hypothetical protein
MIGGLPPTGMMLDMPLRLKSEATEDFVRAVQAIEDTADLCYRDLEVFKYPRDLARWALLSRIVLQIEQAILQHGYRTQTQSAVMYNLGRGGAQALAWVADRGAEGAVSPREFLFDGHLFAAAEQLLWTAVSYESFTTGFPLWHKSAIRAELVKTNVIRFGGEDKSSRRVRAYLQGLKPAPDREPALELGVDLEPYVKLKIQNIANNGTGDRLSFTYGRPAKLYAELYERYFELSRSQFRHSDSFVVGPYQLGEFRSFYAALLAVCAVHEHACFVRAQLTKMYPTNSGVIVKRRPEWVKVLSKVCHLSEQMVSDMVADLTFGATKTLDLYVHPFVKLSEKPHLLGLVPHFPLKSRPDENILRVCSYLYPPRYDAIASAKEEQMRKELQSCAHPPLQVHGPRVLPGGLPDIDLIVEDTKGSAVVIAELKWLRKAIRSVEHPVQEAAFLRGIGQLEKIREFLRDNPLFLLERGDLVSDLRNVREVHYILIPRDYFVWVDPGRGIPVIDYDPFRRMLTECEDLAEGMEDLLTFDWLPLEERDFAINYETFTVNGVSVETEVIYAKY